MKLVKTLLATTLALTAFSTFAAKHKAPAAEEKVVVSTQEQPTATASEETQAAGQPTAQPATSESAAETPATPAPQAGQ